MHVYPKLTEHYRKIKGMYSGFFSSSLSIISMTLKDKEYFVWFNHSVIMLIEMNIAWGMSFLHIELYTYCFYQWVTSMQNIVKQIYICVYSNLMTIKIFSSFKFLAVSRNNNGFWKWKESSSSHSAITISKIIIIYIMIKIQ